MSGALTRNEQDAIALRRKIYMSILGGDAWRLYHAGTHPALLEDLYPLDKDPDALYDALVARVISIHESAYNTQSFQARLVAAVQPYDSWEGMGMGPFGEFWWDMPSRAWMRDEDRGLPGIDLADPAQFNIVILTAAVGAFLYSTDDHRPGSRSRDIMKDYTEVLHARLAPLWFEVCDAVAGITLPVPRYLRNLRSSRLLAWGLDRYGRGCYT